MRKKICIRAEGGAYEGMGHVMRMSELARVLAQDMDVIFVSKTDPCRPEVYEPGIHFLRNRGFLVETLPVENFLEHLTEISADAFLTDSYDVSETYFDFLQERFPVNACMDDENDICDFFNVSLIINQNSYATKLDYKTSPKTQKLLGLDYLILRDEFIGHFPKKISSEIQKVMVTVGGSDSDNVTERIINSLLPIGCHVKVIIEESFIHEDKLLPYASGNVELCRNAVMSVCMDWCDVAVSACGTTAYELMAMGVPTLGLSVAENQNLCLETLGNEGMLLPTLPERVGRDILRLTKALRQSMSRKGNQLIDGKGKYRIAATLKEIMESE